MARQPPKQIAPRESRHGLFAIAPQTARKSARRRRPSSVASPELSALRSGLDGVVAANGAFYLVGGEPGIGKTRLTLEFAREAARAGPLSHRRRRLRFGAVSRAGARCTAGSL
jgi:predicted ATP-dependent serine protease